MIFWLALLIHAAHAEYRAFELVITDVNSGQERKTVSNLDPRQYRRYYPTKLGETVMYTSTWMCRGNTSHFQSVCPNPGPARAAAPTAAAANTGPAIPAAN